MKRKFNFLLFLFRHASTNSLPESPAPANKAPTQQDAQMLVLLALRVADA